jgi:hypothetical protein
MPGSPKWDYRLKSRRIAEVVRVASEGTNAAGHGKGITRCCCCRCGPCGWCFDSRCTRAEARRYGLGISSARGSLCILNRPKATFRLMTEILELCNGWNTFGCSRYWCCFLRSCCCHYCSHFSRCCTDCCLRKPRRARNKVIKYMILEFLQKSERCLFLKSNVCPHRMER